MDQRELEERTKTFALNIIRFVSELPKNKVTDLCTELIYCDLKIDCSAKIR